MNELNDFWDYLVDHNLASEETLKIITNINGYNEQTLNDVLYATTGYRDLEQLKEQE